MINSHEWQCVTYSWTNASSGLVRSKHLSAWMDTTWGIVLLPNHHVLEAWTHWWGQRVTGDPMININVSERLSMRADAHLNNRLACPNDPIILWVEKRPALWLLSPIIWAALQSIDWCNARAQLCLPNTWSYPNPQTCPAEAGVVKLFKMRPRTHVDACMFICSCESPIAFNEVFMRCWAIMLGNAAVILWRANCSTGSVFVSTSSVRTCVIGMSLNANAEIGWFVLSTARWPCHVLTQRC